MVKSHAKRFARALLPAPLYRRYRRRRLASLIANYPTHDVTHDYGGHTLRVRLADPLAAGWYDCDKRPPPGVPFLREQGVLVAGARVFDIGAHQGVVALVLAREVGADGQVIAVEADPHNARMARENRELNDAENLTIVHAAGGAGEGTVAFSADLNGRVNGRGALVEVPMLTVDGLSERHGRPDLVIIDVEGLEEQVLGGAGATLANGSTAFLIEVHDERTIGLYGGSAGAVAERLGAFDRYVSPSNREPFVPLGDSMPTGRFFLAAIPRRSG